LKIPDVQKGKNDYSDTAKAYIAVKFRSEVKYKDSEFTTISAECRSTREVEEVAETLIKDLRTLKKQANSFFKKR